MEEKFELILKLRLELKKLYDIRDSAEKKYNDCKEEMSLSLDRYLKLEQQKENIRKLEAEYTDKKITMSCLFTLPIGIVACIIFLILNRNMPNILFLNIMKCIISIISLSVVTMVSALLFIGFCPEKVESLLLQTFPSLKKYHNKINVYYNELVLEKEKLDKLKIDTEKLYDEYILQNMLICKRTKEFFELEEEYFYSLGNNDVEKQMEVVPINSEGNAKKKVKVPNNK